MSSYYKEGRRPDKMSQFPSSNIRTEDKGHDYCMANACAIYDRWLYDFTAIPYSERSRIDMLRKYGNARQDQNFYKPYINQGRSGSDSNTKSSVSSDDWRWEASRANANKKGWFNVMWEIFSTATKIKSSIIGRMKDSIYDISVDNTDLYSLTQKERKKYKAMMMSDMGDQINELRNMAGLKTEDQPEFEDKKDIELYDEMGGFKTDYAVNAEKLIKHILNYSEFEEDKDRIVEDFIDIGYASMIDRYNEETKQVYAEYIDPKRVVLEYSEKQNHKDASWGGYLKDYSVSELRAKGVPEDVLKSAAQYYSGYLTNPAEGEWANYNVKLSTGHNNYGYDHYKIRVFHAYWVDVEWEQYLYHTNKHGKTRIVQQEYGYENSPLNKNAIEKGISQEVEVTGIRTIYFADMIVDSHVFMSSNNNKTIKYLIDWGKYHDIPRPRGTEVKLPIHLYKQRSKPITEQLKPIYDVLHMSWLRFQDAIVSAQKKGYAFNFDALKNINVGGKNDPLENFRQLYESGKMLVKYSDVSGNPNVGTRAVEVIEGGVGVYFNELIQAINSSMTMIEVISGINPITLGGMPDPRQAAKTSELSAQGTDNTLRPILNGIHQLKLSVSESALLRLQIMLSDGRATEGYIDVIGERGIKVLVGAEKNNVQYGFNLIPRPTLEERQELKNSINIALQNGRDGQPTIDISDKITIDNMMAMNMSPKFIGQYLKSTILKRQKERDKRTMQNITLQQEEQRTSQAQQAEIENMKKENESKREVMVYDEKKKIDIAVEVKKAELERENMSHEHSLKMKEKKAEM